jgi:hypothetical protein
MAQSNGRFVRSRRKTAPECLPTVDIRCKISLVLLGKWHFSTPMKVFRDRN